MMKAKATFIDVVDLSAPEDGEVQGVPKLFAPIYSNIFETSQLRKTMEFLCTLANTMCYNMLKSHFKISPVSANRSQSLLST